MPRPSSAVQRRATNVTLPEDLLREAKGLGINLSQACESGLAVAVAQARRQEWERDNQAGVEDWNQRVQSQGMPLDKFRRF